MLLPGRSVCVALPTLFSELLPLIRDSASQRHGCPPGLFVYLPSRTAGAHDSHRNVFQNSYFETTTGVRV